MKLRYECCSVGSDESGTGGLFGSCVFAGVKLTRSSLRKIQTTTWFRRVEKIKDSKKLEEKECIYLSEEIEKALKEDVDFKVWVVRRSTYNDMWQIYKNPESIKCICHNWIHRTLVGDTTFHVIDYFFKKDAGEYYRFLQTTKSPIVPIDKFVKQGEVNCLSISLASIIARGRYLKCFYKLQKYLGINLSDKDNHYLPSTKIEPILRELEKRGANRNRILNEFCKGDIVEKYIKKSGTKIS